ncbi:MFS general substrate transporter [Metschnikowia bicuspidata var. bicuspidata NRRL YB-4993]|uniref:MFS general substrate transporter n=1 Tax=Metschnikowia bicuspidata var. bicuspidata NRRL YB-4993 TaxID=869754 RepID=A0A1A0H201_9ASCO|nr:MFS general substrate transporter [Metschnikowia bicuspidata var. bicuspidata NRRL YB-4993]OBA18059.1 MFS general substrate transporter [Metschnikowia bicuspidata var. bicuspidata NRRL YB-4993]
MPVSMTSSVHSELVRNHNKNAIKPPSLTARSIKKYFATRFSTLFVSKEERAQYTWSQMLNPFGDLKHMTLRNWNFFFMGFAAWTWDSVDFFAVSLNASSMAETFDRSVKDVTWGITLVLMLRSVGALLFGYWGDRYGRKWPYVINLSLLVVLQIGTGFVQTYEQFLGVRAIFGVAMGGVYGFSLATSLDDSPVECRGVLSGIFQEGYAFGYLLAVIFNRAITDNSPHGWRALFWFAACPPVLFIAWRLWLPETETYRRQRGVAKARKKLEGHLKWYQPSEDTKDALKRYWLTMIYCVLLMAGFNFMSHGSQDLYPTLLSKQLEFGEDRSTVTNAVANLGAIFGGTVCGHASTFIGRRLTIICAVILGGAMIYPWAYLKSSAINAGAFFMQAGVQGAWGVIPVHLSELSPPAYRSLVVGLSYQLGNMVSSASSTIESSLGEQFPITTTSGEAAYDYSKVMSIFVGCVFGYVLIVTLVGPEKRGVGFETEGVLIHAEEAIPTGHVSESGLSKREAIYLESSSSLSQ